MSEPTAKKRTGSVLDLFLIGLAVLSVLGLFLQRHVSERAEPQAATQARISMRSHALPPLIFECLSVGEPLYTEGGEVFGRISALKTEDAKIEPSFPTATAAVWPREERCVIELEAEVQGYTKNGIFLYQNRFPLSVGKQITLYSEKTHVSFVLYKIETEAV